MRLLRFRQGRECRGLSRRRRIRPAVEPLEGRIVLSLTATGPEFRVNATTANDQFSPAVAVDPNGDTVVAFQSGTPYNGAAPFDIKVQRYNASGVAQGGEITANTTLTDVQIQPAVAIDAAGDFVVVWTSYQTGNYDIFAQRFNAAGVKQGGEIAVNTTKAGGQVQPTVAMDPLGNFVIAWTSGQSGNNDIIYQRYNAAGVPQGPETQANNTTAGSQSNPTVAMDGSGNFVIAWQSVESTNEIRFRRFNASGEAFSGDVVANTSAGDQANPAIAMRSTGEFVITWDGNGPGDAQGIFFRRYAAAGVAQDASDVRANSTTGATAPTIGINSRGDFAIAWTNNDGSGTGVFAQQFFATGSKSGAEFRANTTTVNGQSEPSLGSNADGDIFIAWRSDGQDGDKGGVYAQRFLTNLHAPTTTGIPNVNVLEDAANTVINLVDYFNDQEDGPAGLTYSIVDNSNPGLFTSVSINNGSAQHPLTLDYAPNANGSATLKIRATDTTGYTVDATFTVNVAAVNDAPTIDAISNRSLNQNAGAQTINLSGISVGPANESGQTITVTATSDNPGLIPSPISVTYASPNATGSLSFTPVAGQFGVAHITVTVKDNGGTSNGGIDTITRTFTVTVNGAPTANNQSVTTNQNTARPITLTGSDPESESLTYIVTANPAHGTLSGTAPNLTYTPNAGYFGPDTFQFKVNDGHQDGNIGTVSINVIGAPTANAQTVSVAHNTATGITLTGSDPNSPPRSLTYIVTANPAHGTLSGTAPNLTYTPNAGYFGPDTFQFKVNNGLIDSNVGTVTLNVAEAINSPPQAHDDTASTTDQAPITVHVLDNDTDPDLPTDTLTVIAVGTPSPNIGSVTFDGTTVTYTPVADTHGTVVFSYTIRDSAGATSTANVTITVSDVTAPRIVDLIVHWGSRSASVLSLGRTLPWASITAIDAVFSEDVAVTQGNLALTGVNVPSYSTNGFSYVSATRTAQWTFPTALGIDQLMFALDGHSAGGVKDTSGNLLMGGDFLKGLAVLPGDYNGDGVVNSQDVVGVRNEMPGFGTPPTIFGDIDGDGIVDINDYNIVKRKVGTRLP